MSARKPKPHMGRMLSIGRVIIGLARFAANTALWAFVARYRVLLALFALAVALIFSNVLFDAIGAMIYLPALTIGASLSALLLRNVINRDTTDADADSGYTTRAWRRLGYRDRALWAKIEILAYFLGACLIASALVH
jgi:hypothetical protein